MTHPADVTLLAIPLAILWVVVVVAYLVHAAVSK